MNFWRFSTPDPGLGSSLDGSYDPVLVLLSVVIACAAGLTALLIVDRMVAAPSNTVRHWWHGAGAIAMGCGIWGMHFTGMLAFSVALDMGYDTTITLLSLVPAVLGSGAALHFIAKPNLDSGRLQLGALLMALGIGTMHYTGMEGMVIPGLLRYDFTLFCLSVLVAHFLALAAIYIRFGLRRFTPLTKGSLKAIAGPVMGIAVVGMHYTAMAASEIYAVPGTRITGSMVSQTAMAIMISMFAGGILALSMLATWADRQKSIQRMLDQLAHTDALTGLPNRVMLKKHLHHALATCNRHGSRLAVLFLDLDDFKAINDSLGHEAGDQVLQVVADRLQATLREVDIVARFGGDEFVVVALGLSSPEDAAQAAHRIQAALEVPVQVGDWQLSGRASIGISVYPDNSETAQVLIQQADTAMYRAKSDSIGFAFFDETLANHAKERVWLGVELRDALNRGDLTFEYQPWVDLESRDWIGVEALARWFHRKEGSISPDRFIPVAERSGLILELGDWALREACQQAQSWLASGFAFGRIAVNISVPELYRSDFLTRLQRSLSESGVPGSVIEIELTESSLMRDDRNVIGLLEDIRELGVTLSLDDFGTGYSSLSYLRVLPVDKLKIDRALVQNITEDSKDLAIIRAVVDMGLSLGFQVVAEGIETEEQRNCLLSLGCRLGQGFLFARPTTAIMLADQRVENR